MQNIFIDILPPWVETGLQPAFYDLESGTVLQQTARMYAKVRELTEAFNTFSENVTNEVNQFEDSVNDTVEEYIEKFNELHDYVQDYFDNLDVQEEINNKLDDMADDGSLGRALASYSFSISPYAFGAVGDGENDDTQALQDCIDYANEHKLAVYFPSNQNFLVSEPINIYTGMKIEGNNARITTEEDISVITSESIIYNTTINNLDIYGSHDVTHTNSKAIELVCYYCAFTNLKIYNCFNGIYLHTTGADGTLVENRIENVRVSGYCKYGIFVGSANNNKLTDGYMTNVICNCNNESTETDITAIFIGSGAGWNVNGVHIYGNNDRGLQINNIFNTNINGIYIEKVSTYGIHLPSAQIGANISNVFIKNSYADTTATAINIDQSAYLPFSTHAGTLTNINISRGTATTGKSINITGSQYYKTSNIIIDGETRTLENDCTGILYNDLGLHKRNQYTLGVYENTSLSYNLYGHKAVKDLNSSTTSITIDVSFMENYQKIVIPIYAYGGRNTIYDRKLYQGTLGVVLLNGTYYPTIDNTVNQLFTTTAPTVSNSTDGTITISFEAPSDYYFSIFYSVYN